MFQNSVFILASYWCQNYIMFSVYKIFWGTRTNVTAFVEKFWEIYEVKYIFKGTVLKSRFEFCFWFDFFLTFLENLLQQVLCFSDQWSDFRTFSKLSKFALFMMKTLWQNHLPKVGITQRGLKSSTLKSGQVFQKSCFSENILLVASVKNWDQLATINSFCQ